MSLAILLFISIISFAQVKTTPATLNPALTRCNCADLKVTAYLYKEPGTRNYIIRLDYFNSKTTSCTPILKTLNIHRGTSNINTVPLSSFTKLPSSKGRFIYRITPDQLRTELLSTIEYVINYTIDYGSVALKTCPVVNQRVKLEDGEPIL